nr:flavin-containing monooxygenase fmo gs-ox-like 3 [Quercus suber]
MKSVCIVGAGPAGLVAAKTFLQSGHYTVTIYEKTHRIGGIWALDEDSKDGFLSPQTPTNLSRFTVGFSDLDWNSVDLQSKYAQGLRPAQNVTPMFPKAWQVNRYLETYRRRYIPSGVINLGREVIKAERFSNDLTHWKVTTENQDQKSEIRDFDFLLVGSGFFAEPRPLRRNMINLTDSLVNAIHSSQFRTLEDMLDAQTSAKNILLFGGGNSSGETAAAVAMQISDAKWGSDNLKRELYRDCKIIHVTPRPLYTLPPFNEFEPGTSTFVPLDLKLYDFSRRPPGMESYGGQQSIEIKNTVHEALQTMVGGDQSDLSDALVSHADETRGAVYVALSESYPGFVKSGLIDVVAGRVTSVVAEAGQRVSASIKTAGGDRRLDDIAAVIYATGYTPTPALKFLPEDIKNALHFDPDSMRLPLILEQWQTINNTMPDIAFLGFYEGPYWPMMEMQARLIAERWQKGNLAAAKPFESRENLLQIRQAMQNRALDVPQYWFNDYAGYLEDIANHLSLIRNDSPFAEREGCTSPARYLAPGDHREHADAIMRDLHHVWNECTQKGRYVPRAAFRAVQGDWDISRRIVSTAEHFSGTLTGTASFHPRFPTTDANGQVFDLEYMYVEAGTFRPASGFEMQASRRYVCRYTEADDRFSVWFVRPDDNLQADYLFHDLAFSRKKETTSGEVVWLGMAEHLCVEDMYWTEYELPFHAITLPRFRIKHTVQGPKKDYVMTTQYVRAERSSTLGQ